MLSDKEVTKTKPIDLSKAPRIKNAIPFTSFVSLSRLQVKPFYITMYKNQRGFTMNSASHIPMFAFNLKGDIRNLKSGEKVKRDTYIVWLLAYHHALDIANALKENQVKPNLIDKHEDAEWLSPQPSLARLLSLKTIAKKHEACYNN